MMYAKGKNIDMLGGALCKNILLFTLPIVLSSMIQQLFNAADMAMVGFFDTSASLAAVGANGEIVALIVSLSSGMSVGINVLVARQIGQRKEDALRNIVQTAMVFALALGAIGLLVGQFMADPLLTLIKTPSDILSEAVLYLRIYFYACPFLLLYDFATAILRACGNSRYPFCVLLFSGILNVILNFFFVVVLKRSVAGVALATVLSTMCSAFLVWHRLKKEGMIDGWLGNREKMSIDVIGQIFKIGMPAALQGAVFCFANIFVQASVNIFGAQVIAGNAIAMNFEYFAYYVITGFGQTATTFISQNHAAGQDKRCRKILYLSGFFSVLSSLALIVPLIWKATFFAGLFSADQDVIQAANMRMLCILFFEPICSLYEVPAGGMRGGGYSTYPAIATILGTCCFRILWIGMVFRHYHDLKILYVAFPISWVITIVLILLGFLVVRHKKGIYCANI